MDFLIQLILSERRKYTKKFNSHCFIQDDPILDPLTVLRCDRRTFEVAPLLEIVLYILKACLAASRVHLQQHIQENPILERSQVSFASVR